MYPSAAVQQQHVSRQALPVPAELHQASWLARKRLKQTRLGIRGYRQLSAQTCCAASPSDSATAAVNRGASGIDINGARPTSPRAWNIIREQLKAADVKLISPQEVNFAQQKGLPVIDVRPIGEHQKSRIPGSMHAQFMRLITGNSARQWARRAGFAFFGVLNGTEYNPTFPEEVASLVPNKKKGLVLLCSVGGELAPLGEGGRQSRSIAAAYELHSLGYENIRILKDGFNGWLNQGREVEEEDS